MTQPSLLDLPVTPPLSELLAGDSMCARVARLLIARRGQWVDGREISKVGGYAAFRTRLSDLRHAPWHLDIRNRVRTVEGEDGETFKISEYVLMPEATHHG